jgi:hypothetical protein
MKTKELLEKLEVETEEVDPDLRDSLDDGCFR